MTNFVSATGTRRDVPNVPVRTYVVGGPGTSHELYRVGASTPVSRDELENIIDHLRMNRVLADPDLGRVMPLAEAREEFGF